MDGYRALTKEEIGVMAASGCSADDWAAVQVKEGFDPHRVKNAVFVGRVAIGVLKGSVTLGDGTELPAGISDAVLVNCELGDNVRVARIGSHLANYRIGNGAVITDVGAMATAPGATFGNGVELETINEGGGRTLKIFDRLSALVAYLVIH